MGDLLEHLISINAPGLTWGYSDKFGGNYVSYLSGDKQIYLGGEITTNIQGVNLHEVKNT